MTNYEKSLINKLNQLIVEKYINSESITDDLCHDLGISRSNLYRLLKENFQTSPSLYIRKIKLNKSQELLNNSDLKIGEIAYSIGIDSPQNYTKYFTQQFGINPTEYRKKLNVSNEEISLQVDDNEPIIEKPFAPIILRKKSRFSDYLSYYIPGLIVLLLTTFGFYFWQKSYFNDENKLPLSKNSSIAILGFDCQGFEKNVYDCDSLNKKFIDAIMKIDNIKILNSIISGSSINENKYKKLVNELNVKYFLKGNITKAENNFSLKIDLLEIIEKKEVWTKSYKLNYGSLVNDLSEISKEISNLFYTNQIFAKNEKFYLIPNRNMNTYKQFLQSSQLIFNWDSLTYIQK
jgi:adenylate cyclase